MDPLKADPLLTSAEKPIVVDNIEECTQVLWWRVVDDSRVKFNWSHCHEGLQPQPNKATGILNTILHTAIDGFTYDSDGTKIIEVTFAKEVIDEINKDIEGWEITRTSQSISLLKIGHGEVTDYRHLLRLHLIANKVIEAPPHISALMKKEAFTKGLHVVQDSIDDVLFKLYAAKPDQEIRSMLQPDAFISKSGKGARKRDPKFIPDYIRKAAESLIDKNHGRNQARMHSGIPKTSFDRDWNKYKHMALIDYVLDSVHWGYINKDKPVKQIKVTKEYKDLKLETLYVETYEMHLTLTNEQHKKIEALWDLKDLPNPIIVSGYATPKEHYNYPEVE